LWKNHCHSLPANLGFAKILRANCDILNFFELESVQKTKLTAGVSHATITRREWIQQFGRVAGLSALMAGAAGCGRRRVEQPNSITVLYPEDTAVLGPDDDQAAAFLMFLPLVAYNARGGLEGRLADLWSHSPDDRAWTIHLRDGIRWHDGGPVTAHDVKFTVDLLTNPDVSWWPPESLAVDLIDDLTYIIKYKENSLAAGVSNDWFVAYPKHLLERLDPKGFLTWDFWKHPVGNGPFRYVRHVPRTMLKLEANPDYYWGKPKIAEVVLKLSEWERDPVPELLSGDVDAAPFVKAADLSKFGKDARFSVHQHLDHQIIGVLCWNHRHPLFREPAVRRALTLAINRRELAELLNYPRGTPVLDAPVSRRQLRRGEFVEAIPYDLEAANQLLDASGWVRRNGRGIRERSGTRFEFILTCGVGTQWIGPESAVYIASQLERAGIRANIRTLEGLTHFQRVVAGDYQAAISRMATGWGDVPSPKDFLAAAGYADPRFLDLQDRLRTLRDPDGEDRLYWDMARLFQEDVPATFLYPAVQTTLANQRIRGLDECAYRGDLTRCMENLFLEGVC
jgi:peptide/nickel transport system substrate-binding protein